MDKLIFSMRHFIPVGFIVVSVLFVYWTSLGNSFQYDDIHSIVENPHIRSWANIPFFFTRPEMFSPDPKSAMYRPLVLVTYAVNYALGEYQVRGYHWLNLLVHIGNCLLVFRLVRKLSGAVHTGLLAGLIFALHPINSEPVNYISSRSESLCALFFLGSFIGFFRTFQGETVNLLWYSISLLMFLAALFSKSVGIVLPALLLLADFLLIKRRRPSFSTLKDLKLHLPFWLVALVYFLWVRQAVHTALVETPVRNLSVQILTQMKSLIYYTKLLCFPHGQNVEHQFLLSKSPIELPVLMSLLFIISAIGGVLLVHRRVRGDFLFLLMWPLVILLPTIFIPLNVLVNEHRLYLPSVAFAAALGSMLGKLVRQNMKLRTLVGAVWLGTFALLAVQRTQVWQDPGTLWMDARTKAPLMPRPHLYMADHYKRIGKHDLALREYDIALNVYPEILSGGDLLTIYNNKGATYLAMGRNVEAIEWYRRALVVDSTYTKARESLDALLTLQAEERNPEANKFYQQGLFFMISGKVDEAIQHLQRSLAIQPVPEVYMALGMAYERKEDWNKALRTYEDLKILGGKSNLVQTADKKIQALKEKAF